MISVISAAVTDVGKVRDNNEDNYYLNGKYRENTDMLNDECEDRTPRKKYVFSVCDGMGGEACGELASLIAVKSLVKYADKKFKECVNDYVTYANKLICNEIENNGGVRIGSTLALLYIDETGAYGYNIGDSRIYLMRDRCLKQLSRDHTLAQSMVDMGLLKSENMNSHSGKHKLTQHFGIFPDELVIQPYETEVVPIRENDVFIICSDGLTDMIDDKELASIACEKLSPKNMSSKLVDIAVKKGGKDNITVIVAKIDKVYDEHSKSFWSKIFDK